MGHIVAMVYWLGGEWGVFQTSYNVVNRALPIEERRRHMETAYRIDILARTGILLLRFIMREWNALFRILAAGENAEVEDRLEQSIRLGRGLAYLYWITILSIAFLGCTKPF